MKHLPLTKGAFALVDDCDYQWLIQMGRWCLNNKGYAVHYTQDETGKRIVLYMHRLIAQCAYGSLKHFQIDHCDGNRLNNQRGNLRLATRSQNQANQARRQNNSSGYRGVSWRKGRWEARIRYGKQRIMLGRYHHPEEAAHAYALAARWLNQDFAGHDLPDTPTPPALEVEVHRRLQQAGLSV